MQKVINVLALASFAVSTTIVGGGAYVYLNKDSIIENAKGRITEAVTEAAMGAVGEALPGMLGGAMPEMPSATGGVIPETTGASTLPFTPGF